MNKTTTIRVTQKTYNKLKLTAEQEHSSMQDILDKLLEDYVTKKFFEDLNQSVKNLKNNPQAWEEELNERKEWEATLSDGLEEDIDEIW